MRLLASKRMAALYERRSLALRAELAQAHAGLQEVEAELNDSQRALAQMEAALAALWRACEGNCLSRCALFEVKQKEGVLLSKRLDLNTNIAQVELRVEAAVEQVRLSQEMFSGAARRSSMYSTLYKMESVKQRQFMDAAMESEVQEMVR